MASLTAGNPGEQGFEAGIDLDAGPRGTATLSLRMDGSFLTARFPFDGAGMPESERAAAAAGAAKKWLSEAASIL